MPLTTRQNHTPLENFLRRHEFHLLTTLMIDSDQPSTKFIFEMVGMIRQEQFPSGSWIIEHPDKHANPKKPPFWLIIVEQTRDNEKRVWALPKIQSNSHIRATLMEDYGLRLWHPPHSFPPAA